MTDIVIVGVDTGLKTLGLAEIGLRPDPHVIRVTSHHFKSSGHTTKKSDELIEAATAAAQLIRDWWPQDKRVVAIGAEGISIGPEMASRAVLQIGMGWGILLGFAAGHRTAIPVFQRAPVTLKVWATGRKSASKEQVQEALVERYKVDLSHLKTAELRSHAGDAIAAGLCVAETEPFIQMLLRATENEKAATPD